MFCDNKSVITSSAIPHSTPGKRWNALSHHHVREAVAGGWVHFKHIPGTKNPANVFDEAIAMVQFEGLCQAIVAMEGPHGRLVLCCLFLPTIGSH